MNGYRTPNSPCLICHDKNRYDHLDVLKRLWRLVSDLPDAEPLRCEWFLNPRCRFGLHCPNLERLRMEAEGLARQIEKKLPEAADTERTYDILQAMRGYFPAAYRAFETECLLQEERKEEACYV